MLVPFARAVQGFIQAKENTSGISTETTFLGCLQKILTFEDIDIQDFDGNTCRIISSEDPTNSIFIYTNDTSTYLYQVVKASPVLHKNKKIWLCDTYEMEDVATINSILQEKVLFSFYKNVGRQYSTPTINVYPTSRTGIVENIKVKDNFRPLESNEYNISSALCLKIKCFVNPTEENLTTTSADGSYNFFFPLLEQVGADSDGAYGSKWITTISNRYGYSDEKILNLSDVVSKYSPNIKSIEVIPFYPNASGLGMGGYFDVRYVQGMPDNIIDFDLSGGAVWTDCGIFLPQGNSKYGTKGLPFEHTTGNYIYADYFNSQVVQGGGARGFLRTPLGNIELNFADTNDTARGGKFAWEIYLLDEGWSINGAVKCKVPPHYINFYTDNAGQVFIQNLTTNAQELRSLERQNIAKQEEQQYSYEHEQQLNVMNTIGAVASSAFGGNFLGAFGAVAQGAVNAGKIAFEDEFERGKIGRDYGRSLAEYRDKISTQSLLASKQGKQVSGNMALSDFFQTINLDFFRIYIETNYAMVQSSTSGTTHYYKIMTQSDYDYSTSQLARSMNDYRVNCIEMYVSGNLPKIMRVIFGYSNTSTEVISGSSYDAWDHVGLTYTIAFDMRNTRVGAGTSTTGFKFSKVLNFPIRRYKQSLSYQTIS